MDEGTGTNVLTLILNAADAYKDAGTMMPSSSSCAAHARFLRTLVEREEMRARKASRERVDNIDPALPATKYPSFNGSETTPSPPVDTINTAGSLAAVGNHYSYPYAHPQPMLSTPNGKENGVHQDGNYATFPSQTHADNIYYDNMCRELGVTQGVDLIHGPPAYYSRMPASDAYPTFS